MYKCMSDISWCVWYKNIYVPCAVCGLVCFPHWNGMGLFQITMKREHKFKLQLTQTLGWASVCRDKRRGNLNFAHPIVPSHGSTGMSENMGKFCWWYVLYKCICHIYHGVYDIKTHELRVLLYVSLPESAAVFLDSMHKRVTFWHVFHVHM